MRYTVICHLGEIIMISAFVIFPELKSFYQYLLCPFPYLAHFTFKIFVRNIPELTASQNQSPFIIESINNE